MPPKKKGKGKGKGKKGKEKEQAEEMEESEHDNMDIDMLREVVPMLKQSLEGAQLDRNYVQLERDTTQTFYDITKRDVQNVERQIAKKDREMEQMEENHRVEVRVYLQKVKHLEYEHKNNVSSIALEADTLLSEESATHTSRESELHKQKKSLKMEQAEREWVNAEEIKNVKALHERNLSMMTKIFEGNISELEQRCKDRLGQLECDLELRRKVHIHEIEERKNLHINDLIRNHEKAFGQMKNYYNDITNDNLQLIKDLKDEVAEMKKKQVANQKLMFDISQENQRLKEPLNQAVTEVAEYAAQLKDREKDRLSLRNAKARLRVVDDKLAALRQEHREMLDSQADMEAERDGIYESFESAIKEVQQKCDFGNVVLEQKLQQATHEVEEVDAQAEQIAAAANLDLGQMGQIRASIAEAVESRNVMIQELQFSLVKAKKGFNDALRTHNEQMRGFSIPQDEIDALGFVPYYQRENPNPAGFVVR